MSSSLESFVSETPVRRRAIVARVSSFADSIPSGHRVLDVGAGLAPYRPLFAHADYVTHDWPGSVHDHAPDIVGDIQAGIDAPSGSFDAVLCTEVLEHVADMSAALGEMHRLLRDGGRIAITVPFVVALHEEPYDFWRPTSYALTTLLTTVGFTDVHVEPLTGAFGTLTEVLADFGYSIGSLEDRPSFRRRAFGAALRAAARVLGRFSTRLDDKDVRKALPVGWYVVATKESRS